MRKLTYILLLSAFLVLTSADFEDIVMKIQSVSTSPTQVGSNYKSVSLQGGAYIYIKGTGFSHKSADSNRVTLDGDIPCPIVPFMTTNTQIVCLAPPFPQEKSVTVRVFADEQRNDICGGCIYYSYWATPQMTYMLPNAANPGDEITYYGRQRVSSVLDIDYVKIGEQRCDPSNQNEYNPQTFDAGSFVSIPCNLPKIDAGYYSVSQKNLQSTGNAQKLNTLPVYRIGADSYDFAVVPRIDSISNNLGSTQGQILTVSGAGFSDNTVVTLDTTSCKILSQSSSQIQCELQPTTSASSDKGFHSGLKFETFKGKDLNAVRTTSPAATTQASRLVAEIPMNIDDYYTSRLSGYFKAPTTGNYRFVLSADDKAELWVSSVANVVDKSKLVKVVSVDSNTGYKFFFSTITPSQTSGDVALEAGNFYYIELYHQEWTGADYASLGVIIPNQLNDVNTKPEAQSIKITCPADLEVIEFALSNVSGGTWNIKLDYLSADGKKIDKTVRSSAISYNVADSVVQTQFSSAFGLKTTVVKKMYDSAGAVTNDSTQATKFVYQVTFNSFRKNGVLPAIEEQLTGASKATSVTQVTKPSPALKGTFNLVKGTESVEVSFNGASLDSKLRTLGFKDPIRILTLGEAELGYEWRVQFSGDNTGSQPLLIAQHSLEGCKSQEEISVTITRLQEGSRDLFYESIPLDYLFTAHTKPQVTVKSNGITANCPNFNCDYELKTAEVPEIQSATFSAPTLTLELSSLAGQYSQDKVRVFFGNTECTISSYSTTVLANCPNPEAGDFTPRVHFEGIGYALTASGVSSISVDAVISSVSPSSINPNGGSPLVIQGTGFPATLALATLRNLAVKVGTSACEITSVTATQIECTTSAVSADAAVTVTLNGKTGTSASSVTLMSVVPTISSVTPDSVNPVLQTTLTINGANFDGTSANTKIYLASSTNPKVQECLVSSASTSQLQCKLLGAPSGNYKLTVRTSLGLANPVDFAVETVVTGVSPSEGSAAGGTVLTITGGAFSNDPQQTLVFIGDDNVRCDVISSSETEVKCTTRAKADGYASGAAQGVVVATRIVEESVCKNGGTSCSFKYSDDLTPKVTAIDKTSVVSGNSLTITGTGFDSTPVVTLGGVACTVASSTATQIVITIPDGVVPSKTAALVINVAGKGNSRFDTASTLTVSPSISSISPTAGSTSGVLLNIVGTGFQQGTTVKVGTSSCEIKELTSNAIKCKATASGEVSVTYGDFSGVKCTSACTLSLGSAQTPAVSSAIPLAPSSNTFSLTISGSKFDLGSVSASLVSKKDKTATFAGSVSGSTASSITASFTGVAGGSYSLLVTSGANIASSSVTIDVPLTASLSGSAVDSSLAGGVTLSLTGSGFFGNSEKDRNQVTVCGLPCKVLSSTDSTIDCQTPTFINSAVQAAYPNLIKAAVLKPVSSWSDAGTESTVLDLAFTTVYTTSQAACEIGVDFGAGVNAQVSEIKYFPNPATTSSKLSGTVIQGSNDKSTWTDVTTIDANAHDGWNTINLASPSAYRYYRVSGGTSTAKCALAELQFYGVSLSDNTATDLNAIACKASVTVNDKTQDISTTAVNYKQSKTAVLSSISPDLGSTAGNTELTLSGSGFGTSAGSVKVYIDDVECTVQSVADDEIKCATGPAPSISNRRNSLQSELRIEIAGQGNAIVNSIKYFYVDRWSETSTWGGITPPRAGESVSIPAGQTILLDISPEKLGAIIIEGALIFDDANINLHCDYIIIRGGRFQIGTADKPIQNKITVTLYGDKESPQLPTFGNKVIALMEGIIDIHGKPRSHTWTVLDSTAAADATSIVVQGEVDWAPGEQIVIASTEHDHYQSESRTILTATKNSGTTTITFADKLAYKHYAGIQTIDGQTFEMRAEVGLLTRNVVVQGDETSEKNLYGVHIMSHSSTGDDSSIGRISYTEVRRAGQAFNLGRYPIHFHLIGNVRESYILGNAVHHTYNRAVTIHGVHFLKVQKNVAYWVMGHTIFIEDGIETHNVIEDNLVINTMASNSLLNTDQTPASFWITNPKNTWRRNHAAGSDRYGFWFDLREHPEGPSATTSICPVGETLGEFVDNQAHSSGRYGLRIFHELIPRTFPCEPYEDYVANPPIQAEFKNFLGWKNMRDAIIGERLGAVKFKNIKAVDNLRAGIEISDGNWSPPDTLLVEDAWIVGLSPDNSADLSLYELDNPEKIVKGLITPKQDFFLAKNVHFSNFDDGFTAIETCSHCEHPAATTAGARTSFFEGLTFNNVKRRVHFNIPKKEILVDRDGSLTGSGNPGVVTHYYEHLDVPGCARDEDVYNGLVCDQTVTIRRVEFCENVPFTSFEMMNISMIRQQDNNDQVIGQVPYRAKPNKSWAVPFVTGYSYQIGWNSRSDFNELRINPSEVIKASDKAITLIFNHTEYRETYDVLHYADKSAINNLTTLWNPTTDNSMNSGDWYHDTTQQLLHVAITGNQKTDLKVKAVKCRTNCPIPGAPVAKDGVRLWSNATQWPNGVVPQDGDDVTIPANWAIVLDQSTANLSTLTVKGDLHFDSTKDDLVLTAQRIWVQGQMFIGNSSTERFTNKATVRLTGVRKSEALLLDGIQYPSNKVLAVTGNLTMYGNEVSTPYVKLLAPALAGATKIKIPTDTNWQVGDEIAISPTQRSEKQFETRKIAAINNGEITLDLPLTFYHFGAAGSTKTTPYGTIDMRGEVALLTRNVKVEGTNEDSWGGRIFIAEIYSSDLDYSFRGRADLEGIEMKNLGQKDTDQAGLTFSKVSADTNGPSTVTKCVMRDTLAWHLRVVTSDSLTFDDNVFYKSFKHQVVFDDESSNIKFRRNLMIGNQDRGLKADAGDNVLDFSSTFMAKYGFASSEVSDNIAAGCFQTCYTTPGGDCTVQASGPYTMKNNVAHSGETGWLVGYAPSSACNSATHYTGFKLEQGIATFFNSKQVKASNVQITDTQIGVSLNTGGASGLSRTYLESSYIAGTSLTNDQYTGFSGECSKLSGLYITVATTASKTIPPSKSMLPWYKVKTEHIFESIFTVKDVTFADFHNNFSRCSNNFIFVTNPYASDSSANAHVDHVQLSNVGPDNKVYYREPNDDWIGIDDCGGYYCTGIKNVVIRDDGTLLQQAKPASLIPRNPGVLDSTNCRFSEKQNTYICENKGWGILTFESMDSDVMTRLISPVKVTTDAGFSNVLNSYMDHTWDGFYTGLKRYSRFHSVAQDGQDYKVSFTGTVPNGVRWQFQGGESTESVTAEYGYATPQSVKVLKNGVEIRPKIVPVATDKVLKSTDACGTNTYNLDTRKIGLQLTGESDCKLEVVLINAISASVRYSISIEDFFRLDGPTKFIDNIAAILKINPASIRIVEVKSGSSIVYYTIAATNQGSDTASTDAAKTELDEYISTLKASIADGSFKILDSEILNSSFDTTYIRTEALHAETNTTETIISGSDMTFVIIAAVVAGIALIVGAYFAHLKYRRSKVAPLKAEVKKISSNSSIQKMQDTFIESPLARINTRNMSVAPSPTAIVSPSLIDDLSPEKQSPNSKDVFEYKLDV